jgi:membrane protein involved in colicin uptake
MQKMAEQYMGRSRADVKKLEEEVMLKDSMLKNLESYLQDFATKAEVDKVAAAEALAQATASVKASQVMVAEAEAKAQAQAKAEAEAAPQVKAEAEAAPQVKAEGASEVKTEATPVMQSASPKWSSTDYLADIYDDCIDLTKGVNAVTQLRQSACADVKPFDGRTRDEFRGKSFISSIRSAFRQDGLTNG